MTYQRAVLTAFGGPASLHVIDEPDLPTPAAGQVRVRIEASSATFTDTLVRKGIYPALRAKPPFSPGYDFVGRVDALGPGVTHLAVGQRVADLTVTGSNTTYACVAADRLLPMPDHLDAAAAETLPLTAMTAYQMLHRVAKVQAGQRVLIHGGSGSVGNALLQLGRVAGLEMTATASRANLPLIEQQGAAALDYRAADYDTRLRHAAGTGFDAVFDGVGLANFRRSFRLLRPGGILVAYGFVAEARQVQRTSLLNALRNGLGFVRGATWLTLQNALPNERRTAFYSIADLRRQQPGWFQADLQQLCHLLATQQIDPLIQERLPLGEIVRAHRLLDEGVRGRLVLLHA